MPEASSNIFDYFNTVSWLLYSIGLMGIFKKCKVNPLWAWAPVAKEYKLGQCAYKEKEGRTYAKLSIVGYIFNFADNFVDHESSLYIVFLILYVAVGIGAIIYMVRITIGLCEVFERKKSWAIMWFILQMPTALIWGYNKKFVPVKQVAVIQDGVKDSGINLDARDEGLTVNINSRTIIDLFKKKYLLKDIHLHIPKGHMVLLLGGSGAGKTTFLNAVTGYEKADAQILLDKQNIYKEYESLKYDVGFVPQQDLMRGNDTVYLTLHDAASLRLPSSVSYKDKKRRVNEVLEEFGLGAIRNSLVEKLSGGQRKRLSIAMEFISDPSLFILDEPDSGLDGVVARGLFEKLRSIADSGKIVVVITHTPDRVIDLFDDVVVLAKDSSRCGRLAYYGPIEDSYTFFNKKSMEDILLSVNQKEEGGEGLADEYVEKYAQLMTQEKEAG
jgi:ABC-type multidrug transport system ATPase subunit